MLYGSMLLALESLVKVLGGIRRWLVNIKIIVSINLIQEFVKQYIKNIYLFFEIYSIICQKR
jgi:hypothetical protein